MINVIISDGIQDVMRCSLHNVWNGSLGHVFQPDAGNVAYPLFLCWETSLQGELTGIRFAPLFRKKQFTKSSGSWSIAGKKSMMNKSVQHQLEQISPSARLTLTAVILVMTTLDSLAKFFFSLSELYACGAMSQKYFQY